MNQEQLRFENRCVLGTVQALFGEITPAMLAITLDADPVKRYVNLHIAVSEPLDDEALRGISTEVNAALSDIGGDALVDQWVGVEWWRDWPHRRARAVYAARVDHGEEDD
jgi:hypothetical protein